MLIVDKHCSDVCCDEFPVPQIDHESKQVKEQWHGKFCLQSVWGKTRYFKHWKCLNFWMNNKGRGDENAICLHFFHMCWKSAENLQCIRRGGQCHMCFVANFIGFPTVQKFWKSVNIWQSYREFKGGKFFETQCRINSVFKKGRKWRITDLSFNFEELIEASDNDLFNKLRNPIRCLSSLLPLLPLLLYMFNLRPRGHELSLTSIKKVLFKNNFIMRALFKC